MDIIIKKNPARKAVFLNPKDKRGTIIPLYKMGKNDLRETLEGVLEKQGVPKGERQEVIEQAEKDHENRVKTHEASVELRRRVEGQVPHMRKKGGKWQNVK